MQLRRPLRSLVPLAAMVVMSQGTHACKPGLLCHCSFLRPWLLASRERAALAGGAEHEKAQGMV